MEFVENVEKVEKDEESPIEANNTNEGETTAENKAADRSAGIPVGEYCVVCPPSSEELERAKAPVERVLLPADVVDIEDEDEQVYVVGTRDGKVTQIAGLERCKNLKTLILRSCLIGHMGGVQDLVHLEKLELYDNHIEELTHIDRLGRLRVLDLSFNSIREMIPLAEHVPLLEELYMAQNKLRKIEGLEGLVHLRTLDLGANRIRVIQGLETNTALRSLWLGKNKIEEITGLETLEQLEQLDIQNNRLTSLGDGLRHLHSLRELYLACNRIPSVQGLPVGALTTVDLSANGVSSLEGLDEISTLEEVWLSSSALPSYEALEPLMRLPKLTCVYLEHSPVAKDFEYRKTLTRRIPTLEQLDATLVNRSIL